MASSPPAPSVPETKLFQGEGKGDEGLNLVLIIGAGVGTGLAVGLIAALYLVHKRCSDKPASRSHTRVTPGQPQSVVPGAAARGPAVAGAAGRSIAGV